MLIPDQDRQILKQHCKVSWADQRQKGGGQFKSRFRSQDPPHVGADHQIYMPGMMVFSDTNIKMRLRAYENVQYLWLEVLITAYDIPIKYFDVWVPERWSPL